MKENKNIDQLFKQGLNQQFPVDEKLWAAVETQLPSTPSSKVGLWFFNLNTIALLVVLFVCAIIPTDNVRTSILTTKTASLSKLNTSSNIEKGIPSSRVKSSLSKTSNETSRNEPQATETNLASNDIKTDKPTIKQGQTSTTEKELFEPNEEHARVKSEKTILRSQQDILAPVSSSPLELAQVKPKQGFNANNKINKSVPLTLVSTTRTDDKKADYSLLINPIGSLGLSDMNTYISGVPTSTNVLNDFPKKRFYNIELEALVSVSSEKGLSGDNKELIEFKKKHESSIESNNYGLNFISQYKSLTYGFGIHYSKYTERVSYTTQQETMGFNITYDTSYNLVNGNFNSNGVPVILIEQEINEIRNPAIVIVDDQLIATNTFKRIRLPLFIGVQKSYNNWLTEIRSAFVFNYLTEQDGFYINNDLNKVESFANQNQFNKMVYSHKSDFSIGYTINELIAVGTRFSYEYDINSFTKEYNSRLRNQRIGVWLMWRPR